MMLKSFQPTYWNWDVSNVTDYERYVCGHTPFNQPIGNWDVSNVTDMGNMFAYYLLTNL